MQQKHITCGTVSKACFISADLQVDPDTREEVLPLESARVATVIGRESESQTNINQESE